ncbi:MAG: hypothetical protein AMS22_13100 [Thiotrichales bacterium SG8_50]|nr:MAG: hypothetical protein AMS22_13100 [Thiotrichales bacterium SG8_50]
MKKTNEELMEMLSTPTKFPFPMYPQFANLINKAKRIEKRVDRERALLDKMLEMLDLQPTPSLKQDVARVVTRLERMKRVHNNSPTYWEAK